ncbi:hypothetical protein G9A89_006325 [Geosiphon pyriformis]|nr:hypothetical protein G9A89_006325 [Geosiphon pyriformis]
MPYLGREATPGTVLAFSALLCLFLVNISVPLTPGIYFINVNSESESLVDYFRVGLWGWCAKVKGQVTCSAAKPGFKIDSNDLPPELQKFNVGILGETIGAGLGYLAVTHIIALGLALLITIMGTIGHFRPKRQGNFLTIIVKCAIAALLTTMFAFLVDLILFVIAVKAIKKNQNFNASLSNAFWMMVAAMSFLFVSIIAFIAGQRLIHSRFKNAEKISHKPEMSGEAFLEQKRKEEHEKSLEDANESVAEYAEFEEEVLVHENNEGVSALLTNHSKPGLVTNPKHFLNPSTSTYELGEPDSSTSYTYNKGRPLPIPPDPNPPSYAGTIPIISSNEKFNSPYPPPQQSFITSGSTSPYASPPFGSSPVIFPVPSSPQTIATLLHHQIPTMYSSSINIPSEHSFSALPPTQIPQQQLQYYNNQQYSQLPYEYNQHGKNSHPGGFRLNEEYGQNQNVSW